MMINLPIDIDKVKGFLDPIEGEALYSYAKQYTSNGDALEIGSYCGKSAVYIGSAVKKNNQKLYSIDHHKGSEEQQPGEQFFDPDLINIFSKSEDAVINSSDRYYYVRWPRGTILKELTIIPNMDIISNRIATNLSTSSRFKNEFRYDLYRWRS